MKFILELTCTDKRNEFIITQPMIDKVLSYINKLEVENNKLKRYEMFISNVVITPEDWSRNKKGYELHNYTKQELYKKLYDLREKILEEKWRKNNGTNDLEN